MHRINNSLRKLLEKENCFVFTGNSMYPTLNALDILEIIPYKGKKTQSGDVITFPHPNDSSKNVTHRVVSISSEGIHTRGDSNDKTDRWILKAENTIGRVIYVYRDKQRLRIYGGRLGIIQKFTLKIMCRFRRFIDGASLLK